MILDNLDYDELKQLIKERTSNIQTNPVSIPGQAPSDKRWTNLDKELFPILWDQHERVSLFAKSKYGEIERRLDHVEMQLRQFARGVSLVKHDPKPVRQTRRYIKIARDAEDIGDLIQSLSRYVNTQRLAFRKILKKYRKWTGSGHLELRLTNEIFNQPTSFLQPNFEPPLKRLADVKARLEDVSNKHVAGRSVNQPDGREHGEPRFLPRKSSATRMYEASKQKSPLSFDVAFLTVPLGKTAGRACYWIHSDDLIEAKVLVQRHMNPIVPLEQTPVGRDIQERLYTATFDNVQRFVQKQSGVTIGQVEDLEGSVSSKVALSVLWSKEPDAIAITTDLSPSPISNDSRIQISRLKRKDLSELFNRDSDFNSREEQHSNDKRAPIEVQASVIHSYLTQHRDVKPMAEISSTRIRLAGANNTNEVGTWAVWDQDIMMSMVNVSSLGMDNEGGANGEHSTGSSPGQSFPHAVLQIRWEFSRIPEVVRALDTSHVAERVRAFSMDTEAIYKICKPEDMPQPLWQPLLERDIRKVPPGPTRSSSYKARSGGTTSEASGPLSSGPSSTDGPTGSASSALKALSSASSVQESSSATRILTSAEDSKRRIKRPTKNKKIARNLNNDELEPGRQGVSRYWNEFDDEDEMSEDHGYTIYVNPDEPFKVPGAETLSKAFSAVSQGFGSVKQRIISWLPFRSERSEAGAREPLLGVQRSNQDLEDSSDSDGNVVIARRNPTRKPRGSATEASSGSRISSTEALRHRKIRQSHEKTLFRTYSAAFLVAYGLLMVSAILRSTGRHKARAEVDAGAIVGVVAAMGCGIGGVSLMLSRKEPLPWLHRAAVILAFCIVCIGSGFLLTLIGSGL